MVLAQSSVNTNLDENPIGLEINLSDLEAVDRCFQEQEIYKSLNDEQSKTISELQNSLDIERKTNDLNTRELEIEKKILGLKDQEIQMLNDAFNRMKDIADRATKLSSGKSTLEQILEWVIRIAIGVGVYLIMK